MKKISVVLMVLILFTACEKKDSEVDEVIKENVLSRKETQELPFDSINELPIEYIQADHVIDINVIEELIGYSDYVFIAKIEDMSETIYKNVEKTSSGRNVGRPYTPYTITIINNLKGQLKENTKIELQQFGGVSIDKKSITFKEHDSYLQIDDYYIIVASADSEGNLVITGPTGSILLEGNSEEEIVSSDMYKDLKESVKNEVKYDRNRFKSNDEG